MTGHLPADEGMATAQYTAMIGLSLLLFVLLANAVVAMYGRGVLRGALDEGVRAGSLATAGPSACQERAQAAVDDLLGGGLGTVTLSCTETVGAMQASATAVFPAWLPGVPDFRIRVGATALKEREP